MKNDLLRIFAIAFLTAATDAAMESIVVDGVTYRNPVLKKEYPRSVMIRHDDGFAFIDRAKLGAEDLARLSAGPSASDNSGAADVASDKDAAPPDPPPTETFEIDVAGTKTEVTRMGNGPVGVVFFGNSDSKGMKETILSAPRWFSDLVPEKCSFFLWSYPASAPFDQVQPAISAYMQGDKEKMRPDFKGIASNVLAQIRGKTGLQEWLLVGNSLGAGIILWDYNQLAADPKTSFLLVSPTETFMPPVAGLGKLERSMVLAAKGWKNDDRQMRTDPFLRGEEAWDWVASNLDVAAADKITESSAAEPEKATIGPQGEKRVEAKATDFSIGHKIIGDHINNELLGKIIKVKLGLADYSSLAEPPKQKD